MNSATSKRDILDDLLRGLPEDDNGLIEPALTRLIHRLAEAAPEEKPPAKTAPPRPKAGSKAQPVKSKKKTTHYLSGEIFLDLDEARAKLNDLVGRQVKTRISKSRIVDQALKMILAEFEEKGERSPLVRELLKNNRKK